jgi:hypothetical protein
MDTKVPVLPAQTLRLSASANHSFIAAWRHSRGSRLQRVSWRRLQGDGFRSSTAAAALISNQPQPRHLPHE